MKEWPNDSFEGQMNIHLTARHDVRPTLCVNKFSLESDIKSLDKALKDRNIQAQGLRRLINAKKRETMLIVFKADNEDQANLLKRNCILPSNIKYNVNNYIKKNLPIMCAKCQQYGHLIGNCKNNKTCVRCAGQNCEPQNFKRNIMKCINCKEAHHAAYKICPYTYKNQLEKIEQKNAQKTYVPIQLPISQ